MSPEPPRLVKCAGCGDPFALSARNLRAARSRGEEPRCRLCRHPRKALDTARYIGWWRERFSDAELRELGRMIWG